MYLEETAQKEWIELKTSDAVGVYDRNNVLYWYLALGKLDEYWAAIQRLRADAGESWDDTGYLREYGIANRHTGYTRHPAFLESARETGMTDLWDRRGAPDFCSKTSGEWVCE